MQVMRMLYELTVELNLKQMPVTLLEGLQSYGAVSVWAYGPCPLTTRLPERPPSSRSNGYDDEMGQART